MKNPINYFKNYSKSVCSLSRLLQLRFITSEVLAIRLLFVLFVTGSLVLVFFCLMILQPLSTLTFASLMDSFFKLLCEGLTLDDRHDPKQLLLGCVPCPLPLLFLVLAVRKRVGPLFQLFWCQVQFFVDVDSCKSSNESVDRVSKPYLLPLLRPSDLDKLASRVQAFECIFTISVEAAVFVARVAVLWFFVFVVCVIPMSCIVDKFGLAREVHLVSCEISSAVFYLSCCKCMTRQSVVVVCVQLGGTRVAEHAFE
jgi:hypothetical protein